MTMLSSQTQKIIYIDYILYTKQYKHSVRKSHIKKKNKIMAFKGTNKK
jgi:hypothetical protein